MLSKNPLYQYLYMHRIKELLKCYQKNSVKTLLLTEKLSSEISLIPELVKYIKSDNLKETKTLLSEFATFMQIKEYSKCHIFQKILSDNPNHNFIMILKGNVIELGIKYIKKNLTFKEYFLYLTKLFLLKEESLFLDCMKKNIDSFPFNTFQSFIENWHNKFYKEEEKNVNDKNFLKDIDIIKIGKEINMKDFIFIDELKKIKKMIYNSKWKQLKKNTESLNDNEEQEEIINAFYDLYNYKNKNDNIKDINSSSLKEPKYNVYLPFFFKKKIKTPVSFIGDLNYPFQTKNYSCFFSLEDCFIIYIDKSKINHTQFLFKYSHKERLNYISDNILTKHNIFKYINLDYLTKFGKYFEIIKLNKDDILFYQGELNRGVYIITKGSVKIITSQSYKNLIDLNFLLLHNMDYCSQYITDIKKKEINSKIYLNGYYDYKSELNNLMKNPIFVQKSKEKEEIKFSTYINKDIIGLGEIFNYKNNINLFSAKASCDNTELAFIPREIFQALLSNGTINKKCGHITEGKTKILRENINKYKSFFENKINILANKKNIKCIQIDRSKPLVPERSKSVINNFAINSKDINTINDSKKMNSNDKSTFELDKSKIISSDRNTISYNAKNNPQINNSSNSIIINKNINEYSSLKKTINFPRPSNNITIKKKQFNKILVRLNPKYNFSINNSFLSQRNHFASNKNNSHISSKNINSYLEKINKEKNENRCESARRNEYKPIFKNKKISFKKNFLSKSSNNITFK